MSTGRVTRKVAFLFAALGAVAAAACSSGSRPSDDGGARDTAAGSGGGPGSGGKGPGGAGGGAGGAGGIEGSGGLVGTGGLSQPTDDCSAPASGSVTFSTPSGTFKSSVSVSLSTSTTGAEIRYTTDGKAPTASSTLYSGTPLSFTATTRLRAQAFVNGVASGAGSAALYVASSIDATHDVPVIILDSYGSGKLPTDKTQRVFVDVGYLGFDLTNGSVSLSAKPATASLAAFHVRGQSSAMADKVPYRLELRDGAGDDRDCPMFGMPSESDWALVGPHADKTLIHNLFVYNLGREIGLQAPRLKMVEVYVNVENRPLAATDYQGVYQLVETIKNQKHRLNLKQLKETQTTLPEISGGYIFKLEWMAAEAPLLPCPSTAANCWSYLELVDPNPIVQQQQDYLTQHLVSFNDSLHSTNLADPTTGYPSFIEVKSFVDFVILTELTRNMDAFARSQYFYKDRDAKINAGPLWDYDLIAGVGTNPGPYGAMFANTAADGWQYEANASRLKGATADWFPVLIAEPQFKANVIARWKELRGGPLSDTGMASRIDTAAQGLAAAADRNFQRWKILTQARVEPFDTPTESSWTAQLTYMKTWLKNRAAWLDTQWK